MALDLAQLGVSRVALEYDQLASQPMPYFWLIMKDGTIVSALDVENNLEFAYALITDPATNQLILTLVRTDGSDGQIDVFNPPEEPAGAVMFRIPDIGLPDPVYAALAGTFRYELWYGVIGDSADRQLLAQGVFNMRPTSLLLVEP